MRRLLFNKKYSGYIWHFIFAGTFIGLSLLINESIHGVTWYLFVVSMIILTLPEKGHRGHGGKRQEVSGT